MSSVSHMPNPCTVSNVVALKIDSTCLRFFVASIVSHEGDFCKIMLFIAANIRKSLTKQALLYYNVIVYT